MQYSLIRESKVIIEHQGRTYHFDALANYDAETGYVEYKAQRKTIHHRATYPSSKITEQNPTTISLSLNLTNNALELNFFEWLGWERLNNRTVGMPFESKIEPTMVNMYIVSPNNKGMYFEHCFISAIDFSLAKDIPILSIAMESGKFSRVSDFPVTHSLTQGEILKPSPLIIRSNSKVLPATVGASISLQQQCSWRIDRSIHDINTIYNNSRAIVNEMNVSANANFYLTGATGADYLTALEPELGTALTFETQTLIVDFPSTRITKRLSHSDVYVLSYDIIPTEYSDRVTISFNGE